MTAAQVHDELHTQLTFGLDFLSKLSREWSDYRIFFQKLTPEALAQETPRSELGIAPFYVPHLGLCDFMRYLAQRDGQPELEEKYAAVAQKLTVIYRERDWIK